MSRWAVEFTRGAERDLHKLDHLARRRIIEKLEWLSGNFESTFPLNLRGEFSDFYKLRIGDWRVFYRVDWRGKLITVVYVARRDKAYRTK